MQAEQPELPKKYPCRKCCLEYIAAVTEIAGAGMGLLWK